MAGEENSDNRHHKRRRIQREAVESDASDDGGGGGGRDRRSAVEALAQRRRRQLEEQRRAEAAQEVLELAGENDDYRPVGEPAHGNDTNDDDDDDDEIDADHDLEEGDAAALAEEEEDEDGEDLLENAERDYQRIEALDTYGTEGMDDREYGAMNPEERAAAEAALARRDREMTGRNQGFYGMMLDQDEAAEDDEARQARRSLFGARRQPLQDGEDEDDGDEEGSIDEEELDGEDQVNLEAFDVPLREWIAQEKTHREIQRRFRAFLRHYIPEQERRRRGNGLYEQRIRAMCAANLCTLQVSYLHLMDSEPVLAVWMVDAPKDILRVLNEAATRHTLMLFPAYHAIQTEIHVRVSHVPILDSLRDLRRTHLSRLVKVNGVVTRRSAVYPQLLQAYYTCTSCRMVQGPYRVENSGSNDTASIAAQNVPAACPNPNCETAQFRLHPTKSLYRNVQRVNLQETPGSVPPGRVPRTKEVLLADDLIDIARPGEEVEVTGIYEHSFDTFLTLKSGFPVFSTYILANHVSKREDASSASNLSEADVQKIMELAQDPQIGQRIVRSIAPSIFGHENCKMALAMSLFAGVPKNLNDKHRVRGDINVLLLGDPGTAKSQLLKYAEHTAPRAVYSTGKGASAVGLTASVHKDPITREWTLEGGALVLADKGVCLIDEFDKMNEQDRTSIHEAMEQQSISVSKAGIVTSLQARCSVIAAANPIGGRYDASNTLADNVELTDPILQRFDILCVLQDVVDPVADERLAEFVTASHMRSIPTRLLAGSNPQFSAAASRAREEQMMQADRGLIPQELLRKYIQYARSTCRPVLQSNTLDKEKVSALYVALRRESAVSGGVPIAVRHIESMLRMAEAHAKMHLREYVRDDDLNASIQMMLNSFISAQKFSVRRALTRSFAKFLTTGDDRVHLLLHILQDLFRKEQMYQTLRNRRKNNNDLDSAVLLDTLHVQLEEFQSRARERRIYDVKDFCQGQAFVQAGYVLDERRGVITRILSTN